LRFAHTGRLKAVLGVAGSLVNQVHGSKKLRLAESMCSMCMHDFPKILDRAQHLQRLQLAPGSFAMLAVQLQYRDHQQRGSDSRRCPRFVFMQTPKYLRRNLRPLCKTCTQINESLVKVWSKFGQSLLKFCSPNCCQVGSIN